MGTCVVVEIMSGEAKVPPDYSLRGSWWYRCVYSGEGMAHWLQAGFK